jgi:hypothetical protein
MVSVKVYVVVTSGETVGLETVEVNPAGVEFQLYVLPATDAAPSCVLALRQIALSAPATAAGSGFTVTITLWLFVQPVAVMVSVKVYVVVTSGETAGLETVEVKPAGDELQL